MISKQETRIIFVSRILFELWIFTLTSYPTPSHWQYSPSPILILISIPIFFPPNFHPNPYPSLHSPINLPRAPILNPSPYSRHTKIPKPLNHATLPHLSARRQQVLSPPNTLIRVYQCDRVPRFSRIMPHSLLPTLRTAEPHLACSHIRYPNIV